MKMMQRAGLAAIVALGALGFSGVAQARSDVYWSLGIAAPGIVVGTGNVPPVYAPPVYVQPGPYYVQPGPVYVAPPYYAAPPVYVVPPRYGWRPAHYPRGRNGHRGNWRGHSGWHR